MKRQIIIGAGLALLLSVPVVAQELLSLNDADVRRLGLVFSRIAAPDLRSGAQFPAQVLTSPIDRTNIVALYSGVMESWSVVPGTQVEAGQVLGLVRSEEVLQMQQAWLSAVSTEKLARLQVEKDRALFADGVIAATRLQQTEQTFQAAQNELRALTLQLANAGFSEVARSALLKGDSTLGYYQLVASGTGEVTQLHMLAGDRVEDGDQLVSISGKSLWLSAQIPAGMANGMQAGQSLMVKGVASPLTLRQVDTSVDMASQTVGVLAEFSHDARVRPGQIVTMLLPPPASGVLVPADAVVHNGEHTDVYVRTAQGIEVRQLTLQPLGSEYLAQSGLKVGEEVVVRGAAILKGVVLGLGGE